MCSRKPLSLRGSKVISLVFTKKDKIYIKLSSTEGQSHVRSRVNKDHRDREVADKKNKTFI